MKTRLQILLVEDNESDAQLIARQITKAGIDGSICRVETEEELVQALQHSKPDVILSDFSLPQLTGLRALELSIAHAPEVPFIYVSGTIGEERAIDALRRGATDYILKSSLSRLTASIERALRESRLKAEKHKSEQVRREQGIRLQRLTRTYRTLSSTSSAIVRMRSSTELMDEVCRIAVEQGGYDCVSIRILESDGQ
jgi:DNA-binding NtrC family response regulator